MSEKDEDDNGMETKKETRIDQGWDRERLTIEKLEADEDDGLPTERES